MDVNEPKSNVEIFISSFFVRISKSFSVELIYFCQTIVGFPLTQPFNWKIINSISFFKFYIYGYYVLQKNGEKKRKVTS